MYPNGGLAASEEVSETKNSVEADVCAPQTFGRSWQRGRSKPNVLSLLLSFPKLGQVTSKRWGSH